MPCFDVKSSRSCIKNLIVFIWLSNTWCYWVNYFNDDSCVCDKKQKLWRHVLFQDIGSLCGQVSRFYIQMDFRSLCNPELVPLWFLAPQFSLGKLRIKVHEVIHVRTGKGILKTYSSLSVLEFHNWSYTPATDASAIKLYALTHSVSKDELGANSMPGHHLGARGSGVNEMDVDPVFTELAP